MNPEGFAFCGTCGARLAPPATDARPEGQPSLEERKVVTILFADLQGSTALAEQLDPEQVRGIMGRFFEAMAEVITEFGGTVEKFIGDEVMAVFGLPQAHEDDAVRAVRAATAMHDRLDALSNETGIPAAGRLRMRIGINMGEVIANPQAAEKGEFMVSGDAVNVAARLRSAAAPGDTIVGDRTHRETAALAEYGACPPLLLKGKREPMHRAHP
jgi:class 3 adenylate cyclase